MILSIESNIDKPPIRCRVTNEKVINITGEGGSGKTTFCKQYRESDEYIVIDYDLLIGKCLNDTIEFYLKNAIIEKYGEEIFKPNDSNQARDNFTVIYEAIINLLSDKGKTIVFDGTQLRFINSIDKIRGEVIVLRTSVEKCIERSVLRKIDSDSKLTQNDIIKYRERRREILYKYNPMLNELITELGKKYEFEEFNIEEQISHTK